MFGPAGGSRSAAAPGGGLPFAGIPPELQAGVDKLLSEEPDHGEPKARFSYRTDDDSGKHLTLRALIFRHWHLGVLALLLVTIVSVTNQAGPLLIQYGIDHGMLPAPPKRHGDPRRRRALPACDRDHRGGSAFPGEGHRPARRGRDE